MAQMNFSPGFSFGVDAADCDSFGKDATEFLCSDKSNCLSENRVCDGKQDCDDGSDEDSSCPTGAPSVTTATDAPKWQYDKMEVRTWINSKKNHKLAPFLELKIPLTSF